MTQYETYRKFYVVWNTKHGTHTAKKQHFTFAEAYTEACRLSELQHNDTFIVLQAVHAECMKPNPVRHSIGFADAPVYPSIPL